MFFYAGGYFAALYYIPIYFQSVHNASAIGSGVRMLAMIVPMTFALIGQGFLLVAIGIVPAFWVFGGTLACVASGLFYTMDATTDTGKWVGYQILFGVVVGLTFQCALQNAQVKASMAEMSQITAIINCESSSSVVARAAANVAVL